MLRLSIVTEENWASLGINGVMSLMKVMKTTEFDSIQSIDANFIEKLQRMETYPFGFTDDYKVEFMKLFTNQLGKKCLITSERVSRSNQARAQKHMDVIKLINQGFSLEEAQAEINQPLQTKHSNNLNHDTQAT